MSTYKVSPPPPLVEAEVEAPPPRRWQHWPVVAVLAVGVLVAVMIGAAVHDGGGLDDDTADTRNDLVALIVNETNMTHDEAVDTLDVLDDYVDIDELIDDPDAAVADLTPADALAFYAELDERNSSAADKIMEGTFDDSVTSDDSEGLGYDDSEGFGSTEDNYDAPSDTEIDNASDDELWDMWAESPSGSDIEAELEAELDARNAG
jgi:hypothetical protein